MRNVAGGLAKRPLAAFAAEWRLPTLWRGVPACDRVNLHFDLFALPRLAFADEAR